MEAPVALMAELVDALVSGTSDESRGGSSPLQGTISKIAHRRSRFREGNSSTSRPKRVSPEASAHFD